MEIVRGRSPINENTPQIIKKKAPKLTLESGQWRKLNGWQNTTNTKKNTETKGQWKAVHGM